MAYHKKAAKGDRRAIRPPEQVTFDTAGFIVTRARVIRNGKPNVPYLPSDPGRRRRLLKKLGISDDATPAD